MNRLLVAAVISSAVLMSSCADAGGSACEPRVEQGWVRLVPGGMPMHAGFGRIANQCDAPAVVTGARSPSYGSIELHETRNVDGMMQMRQIKELRIAAKDAATMKPGGLHLMLMEPKAPLKAGDRVTIVFTLAGGGEVTSEFAVRDPD